MSQYVTIPDIDIDGKRLLIRVDFKTPLDEDKARMLVGRGILSALGIDFQLQRGDLAARGNFCTVDDEGKVTDRRAGRIGDDEGRRLVEKMQSITFGMLPKN